MFGFNQFVGLYVPWETHYINEVPYGYNIGYFQECRRRINFRFGINGNVYKEKSTVRVISYEFGIEVGGELRILSSKRKWIFNVGILLYKGWAWSTHHYSPTSSVRYLIDEWGMGPDILFGRRIKNHWVVTFESSVSLGGAVYKNNGIQYAEKMPASSFWKWLGFGCRYYLN